MKRNVTEFIRQGDEACRRMHEARKNLLTEGFVEQYGTDELVLNVDFAEVENRLKEALHSAPAWAEGPEVSRSYQKQTSKPWFLLDHLVKTPRGVRLHYTVQNRITGETLCTYRQIKKARQTVRELNAGERRLMVGCRAPSKSTIVKKLREITGAQ